MSQRAYNYAHFTLGPEDEEAFAAFRRSRSGERAPDGELGIAEVHSAGIAATGVQGNTSFCEQFFDATFKDGRRVKMEEVAVRTWKDGKVVKERFYYRGG
jgi:hypothetical protein